MTTRHSSQIPHDKAEVMDVFAPAPVLPAPAPAPVLPAPAPAPAARPLCAGRPRTHEAEDLDRLSRAVFEQETWTYRFDLHTAILLNENLGRRLPDDFLDKRLMREELSVTTLKGRLKTFSKKWRDWPKLEMACRGLYINQDGRVTCIFCEIMFRGMTTREVCHMKRHQELAPNCLAHKCIPKGRRARHNSTSIVSDLVAATCNDV